MASEPVKWVIVGTGNIAQDFVTALQYVSPGLATIVGVVSRSQERATQFANSPLVLSLGSKAKGYTSIEDMLKDREETGVQAAYIGTPHTGHYPDSLACLRGGCAVLCEKPLCINAKQAQHLVSTARENNVFFMEAFWSRYFPLYRSLFQDKEISKIGEIVAVQIDFGFRDPGVQRLSDPALGGGALLDIGLYPLMIILAAYSMRQPRIVHASAKLDQNNIDLQTAVTLEFENGGLGQFFATLQGYSRSEVIIIGKLGNIVIDAPFWCPTKYTLSLEIPETRNLESQVFEFPLPEIREGHKFNFKNGVGLVYEAEYACNSIKAGKTESEIFNLEGSLMLMKLLDEIRERVHVKYPGEDELIA